MPDLTAKNISYTNDDLKQLFEKFFEEQSIKNISLMGFSLGGKIALQLIELFPYNINSVFYLHPDGSQDKFEIILLLIPF